LYRAILDGLAQAGMVTPEIANDIYQGVLHYLQNDCPWKPLKIEELYKKIQALMSKIGLESVKAHLPTYYPEVRISVARILIEIECPMEIALIASVNEEISTLKEYGVDKIVLEEIEEAVTTLLPTKRWNKQKQFLHDEIASLSLA